MMAGFIIGCGVVLFALALTVLFLGAIDKCLAVVERWMDRRVEKTLSKEDQ